MKRRDVLKIAPLTLLGLSAGSRDLGRALHPSNPGSAAGIGRAEVRSLNGNPALFLDGKPVLAAINWVSGPQRDQWDFEDQAVAKGVSEFKAVLEPQSTKLYIISRA